MTTTEDRPVIAPELADLLLAAELVVTSQHASAAMLQRKLRTGWDDTCAILDDLAEAGVVSGGGPGDRTVLVAPDDLAEVLARIADASQDDLADPPASQPLVSLVKPGVDLACRPDDDLELRPRADLAWPGVDQLDARPLLVTRVRQATARGLVTVVDQPVVARGLAVTRQAPRAGARLVIWTPRGAVRGVVASREWLFATRSAAMVGRLADSDHPEWHKAAHELKELHERLATRRWVVGAGAGVAVLAGLAWWASSVFAGLLAVIVAVGVLALARPVCREPKELAVCALVALGLGWLAWHFGPDLAGLIPQPPGWVWLVLAGLAVVGFGWLGRKEDQKLVEMPATMAPHKTPPLTAPMVTAALCALGLGKMKEPDDIRLLMDVARHGQGYQLDLELPPGVPTNDIIEKREEFAAALRRELGTVWPAVGPRHPGHLTLFVSDVPMATATQAPWPLTNGPRVSLFDPLPLFTDQRGQWVSQTLAYTSWVIGAVPRMGKTRCLLNLGLTCALDPRARLFVFDLKGTGDLSALAKVAHFYGVGDEPEDIETMLHVLRSLREEMRKRARQIRDLTLEENPDKGKVTDALATRDPKRFGPIVVQVDEVQVWTQEFSEALPGQVFEGKRPKDPGKEVRDEFIAILRDLVKRGPALGIIVMLATQKPDAKSIPSSIADNASARLCFKVNGQISNDQILGTSSYQAGVRATQFAFSDKGIAYFRGDGAEPLVVRTVDMDATRAEEVASRARALRLAAGLLTGDADEIEDAVLVTDIVDDVEQVMRDRSRGKAHHVELVEWLQELRPEDHGALDVEELSARLRGRGIKVSQIRSGGTNRKGVWLSDLRKQVSEGDDA